MDFEENLLFFFLSTGVIPLLIFCLINFTLSKNNMLNVEKVLVEEKLSGDIKRKKEKTDGQRAKIFKKATADTDGE